MTLPAGTKLGAYEILAPIGAGGMGEVYRARDKKLDRDVAIKVLPESVAADPDRLARFGREAKAVAALSHPNILAIHDFGNQDGVSYAVMELLEGQTLRERLDAGPISQKQAVGYALQIARGLAAAHEKGIVHRDLKPENLFVTKDSHLKILDFGLATRVEPVSPGEETAAPTVSRHTEPGTVMGTLGYMSPEQVRGLPVDQRSDLFSFGAILYELLAGRKAFKKDTASDTMAAILNEEPRSSRSREEASRPPSIASCGTAWRRTATGDFNRRATSSLPWRNPPLPPWRAEGSLPRHRVERRACGSPLPPPSSFSSSRGSLCSDALRSPRPRPGASSAWPFCPSRTWGRPRTTTSPTASPPGFAATHLAAGGRGHRAKQLDPLQEDGGKRQPDRPRAERRSTFDRDGAVAEDRRNKPRPGQTRTGRGPRVRRSRIEVQQPFDAALTDVFQVNWTSRPASPGRWGSRSGRANRSDSPKGRRRTWPPTTLSSRANKPR